jgi:hypothetical protein
MTTADAQVTVQVDAGSTSQVPVALQRMHGPHGLQAPPPKPQDALSGGEMQS